MPRFLEQGCYLGTCEKCAENELVFASAIRSNMGDKHCRHCRSDRVKWEWGSLGVENGRPVFVPDPITPEVH